jgi:hypothetical protein
VKIRKLILGIVVFFFIFGIYTSIIYAKSNIPAPNVPIVSPTASMSAIPLVVSKAPVPIQPTEPNQQGFNPTPLNVVPPTPATPTTPPEAPVKNYQTKWYTSFWFLSTMVILLVFIILTIYSLREGKAPSEEKEEMSVSKKKKNSKK